MAEDDDRWTVEWRAVMSRMNASHKWVILIDDGGSPVVSELLANRDDFLDRVAEMVEHALDVWGIDDGP